MRKLILLFCIASTCFAEEPPTPGQQGAGTIHPWLNELDAGDQVKPSGQRLMALTPGLHSLERGSLDQKKDQPQTTLLVGVHGYASEGYEWVYPLQTMDSDNNRTFFYRWDYRQCSAPAADSLLADLSALLQDSPEIKKVRLVGHSYGGVLVSHLVNNWESSVPIEIHAVAAPLSGMGILTLRCGYSAPDTIADNVTFSQWRTQHHLDNAFRNLDTDPQIIELPGANIVDLPETYRNRRLGHNWSISWVAEQIAKDSSDTPL